MTTTTTTTTTTISIIDLPKIKMADFIVEDIIGEGSFSDVFKVSFRPRPQHQQSMKRRRPVPTTTTTTTTASGQQFALKCLKLKGDKEDTEFAMDDLLLEASMLERLNHKNIIKAYGMSESPAMLLLELLLECTLEDRIQQWRKEEQQRKTSFFKNRNWSWNSSRPQQGGGGGASPQAVDFRTRTESIVRGIAEGLEYLHSQNIILRDLKPQNIGFDSKTGDVKLFDFGLACKVSNMAERQNLVGSVRYMPPELLQVAAAATTMSLDNNNNNNSKNDEQQQMQTAAASFATDSYSFGMVLWEMATLEEPFSTILVKNKKNTSEHDEDTILFKHVVQKGYRPKTKKILNSQYRALVKQCWDYRPVARPSFSTICHTWLSKIYPDKNSMSVMDEEDPLLLLSSKKKYSSKSSRSLKQHSMKSRGYNHHQTRSSSISVSIQSLSSTVGEEDEYDDVFSASHRSCPTMY